MSSSLRELAGRIARLERAQRRATTQPQLAYSALEDGAISVYTNDSLTMLIGSQYDGTTAAVPVNGLIPPTPLLPGVNTAPGGLVVVWSGLFEAGAVAPMDFARVEIHVSTDPAFEPSVSSMRGVFSSPLGGEFFTSLPTLAEHYVRLVTRSESGQASAPSAAVAGTPTYVETAPAPTILDDLTDVDTSTTAPTGGQALVWDAAGSLWKPATVSAGGGSSLPVGGATGQVLTKLSGADGDAGWATAPGASSGAAPTVQASAVAFVNNSSAGSVTLPTGIAAGDFLFIFTGHGFATSTIPSGWMNLGTANGSGANGTVFWKKADGTESGTAIAINFASAYFGEIAAVVVRGAASIRDLKMAQAGSGASLVIPSMFQVAVNDLYLAFGMARATNTTVTCSVGTLVAGRSADSNAGIAVYRLAAPGGPQQATMTSSVTSAGFAVAGIAVAG